MPATQKHSPQQLVHRSEAYYCHVMPVRMREGGNREAGRASKGKMCEREGGGLWGPATRFISGVAAE